MSPWLLRTAVAAVAYAITLLIAALVLPNFTIRPLPFIVAVAIFTLAMVLIKPAAEKIAGTNAKWVEYAASLVTVLLALIITVLLSDGISIKGFWTWVFATLIVWLGTFVYDIVDDRVIAEVKRRLPGSTGRSGTQPAS